MKRVVYLSKGYTKNCEKVCNLSIDMLYFNCIRTICKNVFLCLHSYPHVHPCYRFVRRAIVEVMHGYADYSYINTAAGGDIFGYPCNTGGVACI